MKKEIFLDSLFHLDDLNEPMAKEHYGFYVMTRDKKNNLKRQYFSQKHKIEYATAKILQGNYRLNCNLKKKTNELLIKDETELHARQIILTIQQLFNFRVISTGKTNSLIRGLNLFYKICLENNINNAFENGVYSLKTEYQIFAYSNLEFQAERRLIGEFLTEVSNINTKFQKYRQSTNKIESNSYAIPSVVIYQMNKFAIKEMNHNIEKYRLFQDSLKKVNEVLKQKNLLKTIINEFQEKKQILTNYYIKAMIENLDEKHLVMLEPYLIKKEKLNNRSIKFKKNHQSQIEEIEEYLKDGVIFEKNNETFIIWESIITNGIFKNKVSDKYKNIFNDKKLILNSIAKIMNVSKKVSRIRLPGVHEVYPLYLLCLMETGHNHETLQSWEIRKVNGRYEIGTDKLMVISIDGVKIRGGEKVAPTLISKKHNLYKFITFYLEWATPIYDETGDKSFFQYYVYDDNSGNPNKKISDGMFLGNLSSSEHNFFKKYNIFNSDDEKIDWVNHSEIRKSSNYQRKLQGKTEYERRVALNHTNSKTAKIHYERNLEWNEDKNIKLGDILELIFENIFSGKIEKEEQKNCSEGLFADCSSNNTNPNYIGIKEKNKHIECLNWKKCLTQCDNCIVIPKIHGPAIVAWIDYLEELKDNFISIEYWIKEGYELDLKAANEVIKKFTDEELKLSKVNSFKYYNIVRIDFSIKKEVI